MAEGGVPRNVWCSSPCSAPYLRWSQGLDPDDKATARSRATGPTNSWEMGVCGVTTLRRESLSRAPQGDFHTRESPLRPPKSANSSHLSNISRSDFFKPWLSHLIRPYIHL